MTKPIVFRHWQQHTEASTHSLVSLVVHWVGPVTVEFVFVCWIWIGGSTRAEPPVDAGRGLSLVIAVSPNLLGSCVAP